MEFNVNNILKDELVKVTDTLLPPGARGDVHRLRSIEQCVSQIIDDIGKMSTLERGLKKVTTSSEKLRNAPTQSVYLLKDSAANSGQGQVIGLLKVGKKHLILLDDKNEVREFEPLCILDFFVRREYRRNGHGRRLFDYMLQMEGVRPDQMAVDGPSPNIMNFLRKNYGLHQLVKQSNNFAVTPTFFTSVKELGVQPTHNQPEAAVDHYAGMKLSSCVGNIIQGDGDGGFIGATTYEAAAKPPEEKLKVSLEETLAVSPGKNPDVVPAGRPSPRRDSQVTPQGHLDLKYYHNKLCVTAKSPVARHSVSAAVRELAERGLGAGERLLVDKRPRYLYWFRQCVRDPLYPTDPPFTR